MTAPLEPGWPQIDPELPAGLAAALELAARQCRPLARDLSSRLPAGTGPAADAAATAGAALAFQTGSIAGCLQEVAGALCGLAAALGALRNERRPADAVLAAGAPAHAGPVTAALLTAARQRLDQLDAAWWQADGAAARRIRGALSTLPPPAPPPAAGPVATARWWAGLLPPVRALLLRDRPALIGGAAGVPVAARDRANRAVLAAAGGRGHRPPAVPAGVPALRTAVRRSGSSLLAFDPRGDGTAVVALGQLPAARHVAVLVPGMATELTDIGHLVAEAAALLAAARPADHLAVVAWLGYDTPRLSEVTSRRAARAGADLLAPFVRSLATTAPEADVTVIGHSYGSLVAGLAARQGMPADRLVFVGSPGVGVSRAGALLPAGRVWAARAPDDPIRSVFGTEPLARWLLAGPAGLLTLHRLRVDHFGPDPTGKAFGARGFSVRGSHGHGDYFRPGSASVRGMAAIATGGARDRPQRVASQP